MHIVDRQGAVILTLKSKSFSAHNKWYIYSGNSAEKADKIATVKPQSGSVTAEACAKSAYFQIMTSKCQLIVALNASECCLIRSPTCPHPSETQLWLLFPGVFEG